MKKKFLFLFFLIYSLSFSLTKAEIEKEIQKDRIETIQNVYRLRNTKEKKTLAVTVYSADVFLEEISMYKERFNLANLVLVFPKIESLDKYLAKVAELFDNVVVYILDGDIKQEYLEDRDYEDFLKTSIPDKLQGISNVSIYRLEIDDKDLPKVIEDVFLRSPIEHGNRFKKYFNWR